MRDNYILACIEYADEKRLACAEDAKEEYQQLRATVARLREALEPFARLASEWGVLSTYLYEDSFINEKITVRDVLRAAAALSEAEAAHR